MEEEKTKKIKMTKKSPKFFISEMFSELSNNILIKDPRKNKAELKDWIIHNIP